MPREQNIIVRQLKKFFNYTSQATLWQKNAFVAEVTFNLWHILISYCFVAEVMVHELEPKKMGIWFRRVDKT